MLRISSHPSSGRAWQAGGVAAAVLAFGALASAAPPAAKSPGSADHACAVVTQDSLQSCRNAASDEYWIAIARCDNASDGRAARGRNSCGSDAHQQWQAQTQDCTDQVAARNDVCDLLGGKAYHPQIDPADFPVVPVIDNTYYTLTPGKTFHYRTNTAQGVELDDVEVTDGIRSILGVNCIEVHDVVKLNGELTEDTLDWYAQDKAGNVWYFGEDARQYADGFLTGIDGAWRAGVDGAFPGIVMEASPKALDFYRQEYAIGEAEDVAQVLAVGTSVTVPYGSGTYTNALETDEFSGLEPTAREHKFYVPGVGFVRSDDLETGDHQDLLSITP